MVGMINMGEVIFPALKIISAKKYLANTWFVLQIQGLRNAGL